MLTAGRRCVCLAARLIFISVYGCQHDPHEYNGINPTNTMLEMCIVSDEKCGGKK